MYKIGEKLPISAYIICLNEEKRIENALKSLHFVNEIIVIDSFSTDNTLLIAKKYTTKVYQNKFVNFSDQRNVAMSKVTQPWVLRLDADEYIPKKLVERIYDLVNNDIKSIKKIYQIPRRVIYFDRIMKYSGMAEKPCNFLFNFNDFKYKNAVHETADVRDVLRVPEKNVYLVHNTYLDLKSEIRKADQYSTLRSKEMFANNKKITNFHLVVRPFGRFFYHYIIRFGFLDMRAGFVFAKMRALEVYWRYLKCLVLQNNETYE